MCYSAQAWQDYRKYKRETEAEIGIQEYVRLFWDWKSGASTVRLPKAMIDAFADATSGDEGKIRQWIEAWKIEQTAKLEQALFAQKKRLATAERTLKARVTKKAQYDQRIATSKIEQAKLKLADLQRTESRPRDARFFPGNYAAVMVAEAGKRIYMLE